MQDLRQFFAPIHFLETGELNMYDAHQPDAFTLSASIKNADWEEADIVIVGCGESRGADENAAYSHAPDAVRKQFYQMYSWHPKVKVADMGNILEGATIGDTRAALRTVLQEIAAAGKVAVVLGGSHDLTLQQYEAFKKQNKVINATVADMLIDLNEEELISNRSFLMDMLTGEPNFVKHYSHVGFQSYYVHPKMLETLDKLRFDFFRLGKVREHIEDIEPVLRASDLMSIDMNIVRFSDAPANTDGSPNGLNGEEICTLARYAGMSSRLTSWGIYGFDQEKDQHQMTAKLIAQMLWYFIDGYLIRKNESKLSDKEEFNEFHVTFTGNDISFLKSKRTNRWWMQLPQGDYVPCSYHDYIMASSNEIPERWLREQERLV